MPESIPENLKRLYPFKGEGDFDPNIYFTVLTHIRMRPGYILDYHYEFYVNFSGQPSLFARCVDQRRRISSTKHMRLFPKAWHWSEENKLLFYLVADGTPDGFFQLAVFRQLADLFYLFWHANYQDTMILTTRAEINALINDINHRNRVTPFTKEEIAALKAVDPRPTVEILDDKAIVTYCTFTKWGGLYRVKDTYLRKLPHLLIDCEEHVEVPYECGSVF